MYLPKDEKINAKDASKHTTYCYKLPIGDFIDESTLRYFLDILSSVGNVPTCIREPLGNTIFSSKNSPSIPSKCLEYTHCSSNSCEAFFIEAIKKSTFERPYQCSCPGNLHFIINPLILNQGSSTGALISGYFKIIEEKTISPHHQEDKKSEDVFHDIDENIPMISEKKLRHFAEFHTLTAEYLMKYAAIRDDRYDDSFLKNLAIARQTINNLDSETQPQKSLEWKKERELIDFIALGKREEANEKVIELTSYLANYYKESPQEFKGRIMELAVVMTRTPYFSSYSEGGPINIRVPEFYPPSGFDQAELCHWLQKILQNVLDNTEPLMYGNDAASIARMAIGYIDTHINSISSLEEVSKVMGFSLRHLNRIFMEEVGISVNDFFVRIKIQEAKRLLQYSDLNIAEIAEKLNYWDSTHFAKMFRKITGKSPREFRKDN